MPAAPTRATRPTAARRRVTPATTLLRVSAEDKRVFDDLQRALAHRLRTRMPHHEVFTLVLAESRRNLPRLVRAHRLAQARQ